MAKWHTIQDTFPGSTLSALWGGPNNGFTVAGNKVALSNDNDFSGIWSVVHDLTDSFVLVRAEPASGTNTLHGLAVGPVGDDNNAANIFKQGNTLHFHLMVAGTPSDSTVAYNATDHAWWRFRHSTAANELYWETSPDGVTWTVRRTATTPAIGSNLTSVAVNLWSGDTVSSPDGFFSALNVPPGSGGSGLPLWGTITDNFPGSALGALWLSSTGAQVAGNRLGLTPSQSTISYPADGSQAAAGGSPTLNLGIGAGSANDFAFVVVEDSSGVADNFVVPGGTLLGAAAPTKVGNTLAGLYRVALPSAGSASLAISATRPGGGAGTPVDPGAALGTVQSGTAQSMNVRVPPHAAGDLLVIAVTLNNVGAEVNVPAGWSSPSAATEHAAANSSTRVLYRFAASTQAAETTQNVTFSSFFKGTATCQVFSNVNPSTPIGGYSANGGTGGTPVANSVTTTVDGTQRVLFGGYNITGTPVTITGHTQEAVATGVNATETQTVTYTENLPQASAGATGNVNMGNGAFTSWVAIQLILNPAGESANWAALSASYLRVSGLDPTTPHGTVPAPSTGTGTTVGHPSHVVNAGNTSLLVSSQEDNAGTWTGPAGWTERTDALGKSMRTQLLAATTTVSGQTTTGSAAGGKIGWGLELRVVASAGASAVSDAYDLTGSEVAVLVDPPSGSQPVTVELRQPATPTRRLTWTKSNANTLVAEYDAGSGASSTSVAFNATSMRWWRIRHAAGTVFWETSPDSVTWTVRRSVAAPFDITSLELRVATPSGSGTATAFFSKLNLPTVPTVPPVDPFPAQPPGQPIGSWEAVIDNGLLMTAGVAVGGPEQPGPGQGGTGLFEVRNGRIYDPNGVKFVPVGTSLMGPNGFWNDSPVSVAAALQSAWRFNLVRIVTCLPGGCECCTGQTTTVANDLDAIVQAYTSRKMVVLIDYHQLLEGATVGIPDMTAAAAFWTEKANAYKTNPYVWFNVFNGIESGAGAPGRWLTTMQTIVDTIRATGAPNIIVVDDTNFGAGAADLWTISNVAAGESGVLDEGADLTDPEGRIVWGLHMDSVWGPPSNQAGSTLYTDSERNARLRDYLTRAHATGRPVLIDYVGFMAEDQETTGTNWECRTGQLTGCPNTGSPTRLAAKAAYAVAPEFDVGIVAWSGFPLFTTDWNATQSALTTFGSWHRGYSQAYATQVGADPGGGPGGGGPGGGSIPATGQFEAQDKRIYDPAGQEFVPMGTNLAGPNSFWVDNPASLAQVLQEGWGFNTIRLFTCLPGGCDCCRDTAPVWTNANDVNAIVQAYTSRDMVVIIDYHQLDFGAVASQADLAEAEAFWIQQANLWKNNPYVWFQPFNEPEAGSGAPDRWLLQHQRIVNAIRGAGAPNIIVVNDTWSGQGTGVWWDVNPVPAGYSGVLDKGDDLTDPLGRIVYDLHTYDAWGFPSTGDGATRFTDAQREAKLQNYIDRATASGRPLLFGEFGFYDWESETTGTSHHCTIAGPCPSTGSSQRLAVKTMMAIGVRNHSGVIMWNGYPAAKSGTPNGRGWNVSDRTILGDYMLDYVNRMNAALEAGGGEEPGGPTPTGVFSLAGSIIKDPDGHNFLPKGINVTGANSYVWPDRWNAHGKADQLKALGYNTIRLVYCVACASHSPGSRNYGSLDALIQEYTSRKMVVIIDNHEGVLGPGAGKTQAEVNQAIAFFTPLAQQYKTNPYVWFEPFNEPQEEGWGVPAATAWRDYTEAVVAAIRAQGADNICVLNTSHYGQDRASSGALVVNQSAILTYGPGILQRQGNCVFDIHIYSRYGTNANVSDANMTAQFALYRQAGLAVLVGETGGYADEFCGAVCPGDRQGTEALYRVRPPDVGILPWMVGEFHTAGGGTVDDPSRLHFQWMANPPNFSDGTSAGGGGTGPGTGAWPNPVNVQTTPGSTTVDVTWAAPATDRNITGVFVSWGYGGSQAGTASLGANTTTFEITSLPSGTSITIDIGFFVDGVAPGFPQNFTRATTTTTGGGGDPGGGTTTCTNAPSGSSEVGPAVSTFETVQSSADLSRLGLPGSWNSSQQQWNCNSCPTSGFRNLRVLGAIYYTGSNPLVMEDCIVSNSGPSFAIIFCASGAGAPRLRRCRLERPVKQDITYGAGVVQMNGQSNGWIEYCDLSGNADGIQCSGNNHRIYRNYIHDLVVRGPDDGSGTHNDGIQIYSGAHQIIENHFNIGAFNGHSNGCIFTQGGGIGRLEIHGNRFRGGGYQINAQNGQLCLTNNCFEQPRLFGAVIVVNQASLVCDSGNTGR